MAMSLTCKDTIWFPRLFKMANENESQKMTAFWIIKTDFYFAFKEKLNDAIRTLPQNNRLPNATSLKYYEKTSEFRTKSQLQDLSFDQQ